MTLFVALQAPGSDPDDPDPVLRYATLRDGTALVERGQARLAAVPREPGEVVVVVPAAALSWHLLRLPRLPGKTGPARLRTVLEGLLEERVLDDPASLHLALAPAARPAAPHGAAGAADAVWLACCDKAWLEARLQRLERHGLRCGRIVPAAWPLAEDEWLLTGDERQPWLQVCGARGVWRLPLGSQVELREALAALGDAPATGALLAEPAVAGLAERWLQRPPQIRQPEEAWLEAAASGWNLAQFDLRQGRRNRLQRQLRRTARRLLRGPEWRAARAALLLLLLAQVAGVNAWAWRQRQDVELRREAVRQVLLQGFPATRAVVDPPRQMARAVAALRQSGAQLEGGDLEALLQALAATLPPGQRLRRIDYQRGELATAGPRLQAPELAAARRRLAAHGLRLVSVSGEPERLTLSPTQAP